MQPPPQQLASPTAAGAGPLSPSSAATADAQQLRAAVAALYGLAGAEQAQANAWLNAFSSSPAAWTACLELLSPEERPEVSFFAANLLLSKVRAEWHKLSPEQAASMGGLISNKFQQLMAHAEAKLAMQRLGLLLAAVASLSGGAACQAFAGQCAGMIPGGAGGQHHVVECALSMLTALAEEVANLDKARRQELVAATAAQWADVAGLAQAFIPAQMSAGDYGLVQGALLCLQAWLRLSADASATCRLSPGQLAAAHPAVLACLFGLLGAPAAEEVTADRIEGLVCELLCDLLGPGSAGPDAAQERAAVEAAMAALLALREAALAPGPTGARVARSVAAIASALAQRDAEAVCGCGDAGGAPAAAAAAANGGGGGGLSNGAAAAAAAGAPPASPHVLPLAELMLGVMSRPERDVAEAAVDYFLQANTLPVAARPPQMAAPLFASLIAPLLRGHGCYGAAFTSWTEELHDDEEAFYRFREQGLAELLESVAGVTGPLFLSSVRDAIDGAATWQAVEGALFCLKAVAPRLRRLGPGGLPGGPPDAAAQERAQAEQRLLLGLFEGLCSPSGRAAPFLGNPRVAAAAAGVAGAYAQWFDNTPASPLEGALQLLLHALRFPDAWHAAAAAFRALTLRCAARLANAQALRGLAAAAAAVVTPPPPAGQLPPALPLPLDARQSVLEGLVRVATLLPSASDAAECALALQAPLLARTQGILAHGSALAAQGGPAAKALLQALAQELQLMAVLVRGLEFPGPPPPGGAHPAMRLLEAAWPALAAVGEAPVCQADAGVVAALCEIYKRAVQTARGAAKPLLATLLAAASELFVATQQPPPLELLAAIAEVFGEVAGAPDVAAAQAAALEGAVAAAGAVLRGRTAAGQPLAGSGELLQALLAVADAHLVFARDLMLGGGAAPAVFDWAVLAAGLREREPVAAALGFLSHLLAAAGKVFAAAGEAAAAGQPSPALEQQAAALQACLARGGEQLVRTLVLAACDTAPRQLLRALAGVLHQLVQGSLTGDAGRQWLLAALQSPDLPGMSAGLLQPGDCAAYARLALKQPPLPRGRWDALLIDFAAIPRGEGTADALLAYEL